MSTVQTIQPCSRHLTGPVPDNCPDCTYGPARTVGTLDLEGTGLPRSDDHWALAEGTASTVCCGAYATISIVDEDNPVLVCRSCHGVVGE